MRALAITVFGSALIFSGCSTTALKSQGLSTDLNGNQISLNDGLVYHLPAKQFTASTKFTVVGCTEPETDGSRNLRTKVEASYTEELIADTPLVLNYQEIASASKKASISVDVNEAGLITGINTSIEDRTANVIQNYANAAASVVRAVALPQGFNIVPPASSIDTSALTQQLTEVYGADILQLPDTSSIVNSPNIDQLLSDLLNENSIAASPADKVCKNIEDKHKKIAELEQAIKDDAAKEKNYQKLLAAVAAKSAEIDAQKRFIAFYKDIGDAAAKRAATLRVRKLQMDFQADQATAAAAKYTSKKAELDKKLTALKSEFVFRSHTKLKPSSAANSPVTAITRLSAHDIRGLLPKNVTAAEVRETALQFPVVSIQIKRIPVANLGGLVAKPETNNEDVQSGILYRVPAMATVELYEQDLIAAATSPDESKLLLRKNTRIPQYGPVASLNLTNKAFDNNEIKVVFSSTSGTPTSLTFDTKAAAAETSSGAISGVAATFLQLQLDKRADSAAAQQAKYDAIKKQLELQGLYNSQALDNATTAAQLTTSPTEAAAAETAYNNAASSSVEAEILLLEALQRLQKLESGTADPQDLALKQLKDQVEILKQQKILLGLQQEIKALQDSIDTAE